jgi:putative chitinase
VSVGDWNPTIDRGALDHLTVAEDALARLRAVLESGGAEPTPTPPPSAEPPPPARTGLADPAAFFAAIRASKALGPTLSTDEVSGCEAILAACAGFPLAWAAYALATPVVETAGTMQPIKEIGGTAYFTRRYDIAGERPDKARELGNLQPGDGAKYCGRGYVQMTGRANYARAEAALGVPLVADPDLAMQSDVAAKILRRGMQEGWFTGRSLATYLPATADIHQFTNARRIINGQDRAVEIAGYALEFQSALRAGGWS